MPPTSLEQRVARIETILALTLHSYDGPDQSMEPAEFARFRMLLHELRTDVSRRGPEPPEVESAVDRPQVPPPP